MRKKIKEYIQSHPIRLMIILSVCFLFLISTISIWKPVLVNSFVGVIFVLIILYGAGKTYIEYRRKEKKNIYKRYVQENWEEYIDLVKEMSKEKQHLRISIYPSWIEKFDELMNMDDWKNLSRMFNDFDIASCLIYSLTWDDSKDENIIFAFDCAKQLIEKPKEYYRDRGYYNKVDLEVYKRYPKAHIEKLTTNNMIVSYIRACFNMQIYEGIIKLSDFLHILYSKCK